MNYKIEKPRYTKQFYQAIDWLNKNKSKLPILYTDEMDGALYEESFDYPNFWNMPKKYLNGITSDEMDYLQEQVSDWHNPKSSIIQNYKRLKKKNDKKRKI